jgi:hypothetical protein
MRLEILLEGNGFLFGAKSNSYLNLPGAELGRMRTLSGSMFFETCLEIGGHPYVVPLGFYNTTEYINIIEFRIHGPPRRSPPRPYIDEKSGFAANSASP